MSVQGVSLLPDVITSERLTLRRATYEDAPILVRLRTDREVRRFLGGPVEQSLAERLACATVGADAHLMITENQSQSAVGIVSVTPRGTDHELSYALLPVYWRHGVAAEALAAVLAHVLRPIGPLTTVVAVTQAANERSRSLLERLGFAAEARVEEFDAVQTVYRRNAEQT